jgi:hypothetical protein
MVVEVEMQAFAGGAIRRVTVPDAEWAACQADARPWTRLGLELVWRYGQNDFCSDEDRAQRLPSVSMGDVVRLPDGSRWRCVAVGFEPA